MLQENKVIRAAEQVNESTQQQVQQAKQKSVFADAKQPPVWEISDMTSNGSLRGFNIYNAFMQNNPYQYTFYGETVANRWKENFQYILGPTNPAFVDATLSDRDIAWGYCLEYNPNGILWRVSVAGIPHPDDYDNFLEQNRIIEEATNRTLEENEPPPDTPQVIQASSGIEPRPLIPTSEQLERINNPYAGLLLSNGLSLNARVVKTSSTPSNGQWTLVFSSEGNYGNVILYDENQKEIFSCPATSGRIGVTDRSKEDEGPIPIGTYTLDPTEISGGLEKAIKRNIILREDWGFYRVPLKPAEGTNVFPRGDFFLHGGLFPGSAGCIDIGKYDRDLFPLLIQHEGLINVKVIEEESDMLFPNGNQDFNV